MMTTRISGIADIKNTKNAFDREFEKDRFNLEN